MRNFVRALRHAWPYRRRLTVSVVCAVLAAILWGLNFTSIYPLLKLLHSGRSAHEWVDGCIASVQKDVDGLQDRVDPLTAEGKKLEGDLAAARPEHKKFVLQQQRDNVNELTKLDAKLESARRSLYRYQVIRKYIYAYLPWDPFRVLVLVIGLVVIGVVIKCFFEFAQESLVGSVVNRSLFDLRNRFYRNVIHLDVDQFSEQGTSELMSRLTHDMETLGAGVKTLFGKVVAEPLRALSCILIACYISWQLTLMFLVLVPIAGLVLGRVGRLMKQATRRVLERMSSIFKILQESFQSIRVVKAFTMEPYERRRFCVATKDYCDKSQKVINIDALASPIIEVLGMVAVAGALLAGSYLVLRRHTHLFGMRMSQQPMEAETLLQLYVLLAAVADPVRKLSSVFTRIQSAGAAADRIFTYVDRQPKVRGNSEGKRLPRLVLTDAPTEADKGKAEAGTGREGTPLLGVPADLSAHAGVPQVRPGTRPYIEFRNVCFSYDPDKVILEHVNLTIRAGETVALVGPNGCGKSTLVGLIPRFYDPNYGNVLIDGHDLRSLHLRSLRQQIGLVTQEPILFADTIYNNIAYGSRGAKPEDVETAARQAQAHDFILAKTGGYQFSLGEAGKGISGGERQRIALARAILRNPSIIILDEFTSQMDAEKDAEIHLAMRTFLRGRTAFVITHRMHTLEIADRIVVLDEGRIVATGTHTELMATCPLYLRLQEAYNHPRKCA